MISKTIRFSPSAAFSIALLIILSGCAGSDLKTRSLSQLPKTNSFTCADSAITGSYTVLDAKACKTYLGRDVRAKGYQPIYITVTNNAHRSLYFSPESLNLPIVSADQVAHAVHASTAARAIGLGVPGAIGATYNVVWGVLAASFLGVPFLFIPYGIICGAACLAPAVVSSTHSANMNTNMHANLVEKTLKNQYLSPQETLSGLVFVRKKDFNPNFEISLTDSVNQKLVLASNPTHAMA